MGEMQVWFGRMQRWVRKEISNEERCKKRCWHGWRCRRNKCPYEHAPQPLKVWTPPGCGVEPQKGEAKNAQPEGVRTTKNVGEEEEGSHGVWRETVVVLGLRESPMVPPPQSDSRKEEFAKTTEGASINKSQTNDEETQQEEEQEQQQGGEKQEEEGAKEVEDGDTDSDISILRWLQGLKLRGDGGQMKGHKDLRPEVVEEEEMEEPQRKERMSHTDDHGGPPQVGLEVGEKVEKDEDLRQKEKSKMEGHKEQHSPQQQEEEQQGDDSGRHGEDRRGWKRRRWMQSQGKKRKRRRMAIRCNTQQELESMCGRKPKRGGGQKRRGAQRRVNQEEQNHNQRMGNGKWSSPRTYWRHGTKQSWKQQDKGRRPWDCCGGKGHKMGSK